MTCCLRLYVTSRRLRARTGLKLHIATQFTFDADAIIAWDQRLSSEGITLPAHPGIAGPTPLPKLIKYAMACGVGASLNSVMKNMGGYGQAGSTRHHSG